MLKIACRSYDIFENRNADLVTILIVYAEDIVIGNYTEEIQSPKYILGEFEIKDIGEF